MDILVFVINLKTSTDRKKYMQELCTEYGLNPIFIEAVYGKELSHTEIRSVCDQQKAQKKIGRELMLGEIGCALSHKNIYQKMVDEDIDVALILEDDVKFEPSLNKALSLIELFPNTWELVLLGHYADHQNQNEIASPLSFWDSYRINEEMKLGRLAGYGFGTHGYLINQNGAKKLLKELEIIYRPIDHYTSDDKLINVYAMSPTVVKVQQQFETLIDENSLRKNEPISVFKRFLYKIRIFHVVKYMFYFIKRIKLIRKYPLS